MSTTAETLPTSALPLYTVAAAAEAVGVTRGYFYERIRDGRIATVNLGTEAKPKLRLRADTLEAFIQEHTTPAVQDAA